MTHIKRTPRGSAATVDTISDKTAAISHGNNASHVNGQQAAPFDWRAHVPVHPACNLFPPMLADDLKALADDIKKNGVVDPIVFLHDGDKPLQLLDGRNRLDALALGGFLGPCPKGDGLHFGEPGGRDVPFRNCLSDDVDPYSVVLSLNVHRRHLTSEQKRDLIIKVIATRPEQSNRQIAETVKADHKTVAVARKAGEELGRLPQLKKTVGKDGKARPAKKPKPVTSKKPKDTRAVIAEEIVAFVDETVKDEASVSAEKRKAEYAADIKPNGASTVALVSFKEAAATFLPLLTGDDLKEARKFVLGAEWHRGQPS